MEWNPIMILRSGDYGNKKILLLPSQRQTRDKIIGNEGVSLNY